MSNLKNFKPKCVSENSEQMIFELTKEFVSQIWRQKYSFHGHFKTDILVHFYIFCDHNNGVNGLK